MMFRYLDVNIIHIPERKTNSPILMQASTHQVTATFHCLKSLNKLGDIHSSNLFSTKDFFRVFPPGSMLSDELAKQHL